MIFTPTTLFHIHTYRCGHASSEPDIAYIEKAIALGAERIVFTDHCPFPGNHFPWRMDYEVMPEYISSLKQLRETYKDKIDIQIGFEAEYFPSYHWYYKELLERGGIDLLILGQHIYEHADGSVGYSDVDNRAELLGFTNATIQGIKSGFFKVAAHPDRFMSRVKEWDEEADELSKSIVDAAKETGIILEQNISSMRNGNLYRPEFWKHVPESVPKVYGLDAHSTEEMEENYQMYKRIT